MRQPAVLQNARQERPNVEAADLTALVIQALGMILGKMIRDGSDVRDIGDVSDVRKMRYLILTTLITQGAHVILESQEIDINPERVTSRRVGAVLSKMRLNKGRQSNTGKNGWIISLEDVIKWGRSYGLDPSAITGLNISPHPTNITDITDITNITKATTPPQSSLFQGVL